jgi:hypothetical protein
MPEPTSEDYPMELQHCIFHGVATKPAPVEFILNWTAVREK